MRDDASVLAVLLDRFPLVVVIYCFPNDKGVWLRGGGR